MQRVWTKVVIIQNNVESIGDTDKMFDSEVPVYTWKVSQTNQEYVAI